MGDFRVDRALGRTSAHICTGSSRKGLGFALDARAALSDPSIKRRRTTIEGFWSRVDKSGPVVRQELGHCWVWMGRKDAFGYGLTRWVRREIAAHRIACSLARGPIPAGAVVMHACDNPACCNPAHLSLGTIAANNHDMMRKGRYVVQPDFIKRGATNCNAKLTDDLVRELRTAWRAGESIKNIARRTGLAVGTIHPMLHGRTWSHVADAEYDADRPAGAAS